VDVERLEVVVEDERRREIGLFRYALIRPAADAGLSKAQRGRLVRALAEGEHLSPDGRLVRVSRSTLDEWIRAYRDGGFAALVPRPRRVKPRTSLRVLAIAVAARAWVFRFGPGPAWRIVSRLSAGALLGQHELPRDNGAVG